jgi:general secretion pathway protein F
MPPFNYKAVKLSGEAVEGSLEANSEAHAIEQLQAQGLIPVRVLSTKGSKSTSNKAIKLSGSGKVSQNDIVALTQQLSSMLKAGLPLDRALGVLLEITDNKGVNHLVKEIQDKVRSGRNFADALEESGKFSRFYVNMVRAGEASGSVDEALERLVEYMLRAKELRSTVMSALIYPIILLVVAVSSIIALLIFVVPQFSRMFEDMGGQLPALTKAVIAAGDMLKHQWWLLLAIMLGVLLLIQVLLKNEATRNSLDKSMLKWPLVGSLISKVEMARFSRSLSTLLHNGVPLLGALQIVKNTMSNRVMARAVEEAAGSLKQGESLTKTLLSKGVFPPYALHMLRVGEETGQMEHLLNEVATIYDAEVKTSVQQLLALMEPLLILLMASGILVVIFAVLLPMIHMADLVK